MFLLGNAKWYHQTKSPLNQIFIQAQVLILTMKVLKDIFKPLQILMNNIP